MQAKRALPRQGPGLALSGILIAGFLISALTVHPAELPQKPKPAGCLASQAA